MKLYYSPGSCSLSPHIILGEAGIAFEAIAAPTKTHKLPDGTDFYTINPFGYVPVLELNDGRRLREGAAIVQYIADLVPTKQLAPPNGSFERYQLQEWLSFIGTEIHKNFSPLFNSITPDVFKEFVLERLSSRLEWTNAELSKKPYLMGERFTVADAYLFTTTNWAKHVKLDLSKFSHLLEFRSRVGARPSVLAAMKAEGLKVQTH